MNKRFSAVAKKSAQVLACVSACVLISGCGSVSLLIPEESTTKAEFDEAAFDEEFYRTSVPEETEITSESETEAQSEEVSEPSSTAPAVTETTKEEKAETSTSAATSAVSTTAAQTKATAPAVTKKQVVDTEVKTEEKKSDLKYGVKKVDVVSVYYDIYSDGTKVQTDKKTYTKYDTSGFKASTSDLLPEAKSNKTSNALQIRAAANEVNSIRVGKNASELSYSDDLSTAASVRATEMAYSGKLSSTRPGGTSYTSALKDLNIEYKTCIELTCKGYTSGESAVQALKENSKNLSVLTSGDYKKIGAGVAQSPDGMWYWSIILTD